MNYEPRMKEILDELKRAGACADGYEWAATQTTPEEFFENLKRRPLWYIWVFRHTTIKLDVDTLR